METIEIEVPSGKKAEWQEVDGKTVLVMVDEKDNRPVTERIKTFEDSCNELGEDHPAVLAYRNTNLRNPEVAEENRDIITYMKLRIITEALNEGWHPDYTKCEYRYYPWFYVYTKEEYDNFSEKKKICCVGSTSAYGGLICVYANVASSLAYPQCGIRFAFSTKELAEYAGKQFIDIWANFVFDNSLEVKKV